MLGQHIDVFAPASAAMALCNAGMGCGIYHHLPSGYVKIAIENGAVEIVSFPSKSGDFPSFFVCLPEGMIFESNVNVSENGDTRILWQ